MRAAPSFRELRGPSLQLQLQLDDPSGEPLPYVHAPHRPMCMQLQLHSSRGRHAHAHGMLARTHAERYAHICKRLDGLAHITQAAANRLYPDRYSVVYLRSLPSVHYACATHAWTYGARNDERRPPRPRRGHAHTYTHTYTVHAHVHLHVAHVHVLHHSVKGIHPRTQEPSTNLPTISLQYSTRYSTDPVTVQYICRCLAAQPGRGSRSLFFFQKPKRNSFVSLTVHGHGAPPPRPLSPPRAAKCNRAQQCSRLLPVAPGCSQ